MRKPIRIYGPYPHANLGQNRWAVRVVDEQLGVDRYFGIYPPNMQPLMDLLGDLMDRRKELKETAKKKARAKNKAWLETMNSPKAHP